MTSLIAQPIPEVCWIRRGSFRQEPESNWQSRHDETAFYTLWCVLQQSQAPGRGCSRWIW